LPAIHAVHRLSSIVYRLSPTARMSRVNFFLLGLRNRHFFVADTVAFLLTPSIAFALRMDGLGQLGHYGLSLAVCTLTFLLIKVAILYQGRFYHRYWRYADIQELAAIALIGIIALLAQTIIF